MYKRYYKNKNAQANGDHEVHEEGCLWMPSEENRLYLGLFEDCRDAVKKAKQIDPSADGCKHCCPKAHER